MAVRASPTPAGRSGRGPRPDGLGPRFSRRARGFPIYAAIRALGRRGNRSTGRAAAATTPRASPSCSAGSPASRSSTTSSSTRYSSVSATTTMTRATIAAVQEDGTCWLRHGLARQGRDADLGLQLADERRRRRALGDRDPGSRRGCRPDEGAVNDLFRLTADYAAQFHDTLDDRPRCARRRPSTSWSMRSADLLSGRGQGGRRRRLGAGRIRRARTCPGRDRPPASCSAARACGRCGLDGDCLGSERVLGGHLAGGVQRAGSPRGGWPSCWASRERLQRLVTGVRRARTRRRWPPRGTTCSTPRAGTSRATGSPARLGSASSPAPSGT